LGEVCWKEFFLKGGTLDGNDAVNDYKPLEKCKAEPPQCDQPQQRCEAILIDVQGVAQLCLCSTDHIRRLADSKRMPPPIKLGNLVRWKRSAIVEWIDGGCQPVKVKGGVWR
jgi:predicted DNA-binding transcriptional regulator AlpA